MIVTEPTVTAVVKRRIAGRNSGVVGIAALLSGKVLLQFDQSAAVVRFAVASFQEQAKLAAWVVGGEPLDRPRRVCWNRFPRNERIDQARADWK